MDFEFAAPGRIVFGIGAIGRAGDLAAQLGKRAFVVVGRDISRAMPLIDSLELARLTHVPMSAPPEPDIDDLRDALEQARVYGPDLVIGFGGGSALDMAKAVAALFSDKSDPLDHLEAVGKGLPLVGRPLPFLAIPTTAGTGSEATRNAVFASTGPDGETVKASLRSSSMLPALALVDAKLTVGMPPRLTADSGLDAITQLVEPLVCAKSNPLVDGICREGLARGLRALPRAFRHGGDMEARTDMALASLSGGMALSNAGLGAVHGIAGPLGGLTGAAHGAICAALLPHVVAANVRALSRKIASPETGEKNRLALAKYAEVASMLKGRPVGPEEAGDAFASFVESLEVRSLAELGLDHRDFGSLVAASKRAGSMKANPVELDDDEIRGVLEAAF